MGKLLIYLFTVPIFLLMLYRFVMLYEYDTKQRYLKDILDATAQKVKITGVLTQEEYEELKDKINKISKFEDEDRSDEGKGIILRHGLSDGQADHYVLYKYKPGDKLKKGDIFSIYVKSSEISNFSRIHYAGINPDDSKNLYYKAKSECRVEYVS